MSPENGLQIAWQDLPALFPCFPGADRWLPLLARHLAIVEAAAPATRVTSVPPDMAVGRQYAECLEILRLAMGTELPGRVIDVGSGGGYPGLVIASVLPAAEVHLVEPLGKRARLLVEMADGLGLTNVRVHGIRAEEAGRRELRDSADLVTARAVARLNELLEYTAPLAAPGGQIALAKGSLLGEELDEARHAMSELRCELVGTFPMRPVVSVLVRVALFRKAEITPAAYPRRAGRPGKRTLQNQ